MTNNIYTLNIELSNLKDFDIDTQTSINNDLLLKGSYININNLINSNIDICKNNIIKYPKLKINYNEYPFYNKNKFEVYTENFANTINLKNNEIIPLIFSTYDPSYINLTNFDNYLNKKYEDSSGNKTKETFELQKEIIEIVKKNIEKNDTNINIKKYITFYNIDFLLKRYLFNNDNKNQNKIKLYKNSNNTSTETEFIITNYKHPGFNSNQNPNYIIDTNTKTIRIKIKIFLKEQTVTNQLVIRLLLKGDYNNQKDESLYNKKYKELLDKENENNNLKKTQKSQNELKKNVENELSKNYDNNSKIEYLEFIPSDISNSYKKYTDIYFNIDYLITENILNNYVDKEKITNIPKIFFDISDNSAFKKYLNNSFNQQSELKKQNKFINPNTKLTKIDINDMIISPKLTSNVIPYQKIIDNISNANIKVDNYIDPISNNIRVIINNLIKKNININGKNYHIIKKIFDIDLIKII